MRFRFVISMLFTALLVLVLTGSAAAATHTVVPGDSLYKIGQSYGVSVQEIQTANGLGNTTAIRPGQKLVIPSRNIYTVKNGDSLYIIARNHGLTVNDIMQANGLTGSMINPGQRLVIPSRSTAPAASRGTTGGVYTVKSGDSLFKIAQAHGLTVNEISRANGLIGTAIVPGQQLRIPAGSGTIATSRGFRITARDFDALARLVTSEADCQTHEVKVAVAAVVLNRVQSPLFPNNIWDVVYDRSGGKVQFEPVLNGWINRPASPAAIRAARDAINGWDPSYGATFFFEPWVTNKFLHSLPVARKLGAFTFSYSG